MNDDNLKPFCGFFNVLKPPGMTSAQVVGMVRRMMGGAKLGHAGTLDPEAAGILPLMAGKAARLFDYMQDKQKVYVCEIAFGVATDTQDAQGVVTERGENYPTEEALREMLPRFTGQLMQRPPMYSAIKQDGKRLYDLARDGQEVDVPEREVTVHSLQLIGMTENHGAMLSIHCSKGFYVRTLCYDMGRALGCPAHMRFLLRAQSGVFTLDTARTLETMREATERGELVSMLLPPEIALGHLQQVNVKGRMQRLLRNTGRLPWAQVTELHGTAAESGTAVCLWMDAELCAVAERHGDELKVRTWLGE